jgi:hypothetical protein
MKARRKAVHARQWLLREAIVVGSLPLLGAVMLTALVATDLLHHGGAVDLEGFILMCLFGYGFALLLLVPALVLLTLRLKRNAVSRRSLALGGYAVAMLAVPPLLLWMSPLLPGL